ncbi:Ig-like domain-containing protein [Dethiothermospora halolimnae]|uniref:Ig-like domain-containing protein n=1 Tax=Dethiothermospora halolimnae TaxID=3114390 RepID=UPI003CCB9F3B
MNNNKGLTLIEIIIALALLSIIVVGLLTAMSSHFSMMVNTKDITEDVFLAQKDIEMQIEDVKDSIKDRDTPLGQRTYTLFSGSNQRTVKGYPRESVIDGSSGEGSNNKRKIYTIVAETRMPEFKVAKASDVSIELYNNDKKVLYGYTGNPSLNIKSSSRISDSENIHLMNIHNWYVSRVGFNIPMEENTSEEEIGKKYPVFPDDYRLISSELGPNLYNIEPEYGGKHIIYTITPASKSGKMGTTVYSNPVFIPGLPVIKNLKLHLDASMIIKDDPSLVRTTETNAYVKKWQDISGKSNDAIEENEDKQPLLLQQISIFEDKQGKRHDSYTRFLRFNGNQSLKVPHNQSINLENLTVFAVTRGTEATANKSIISKYGDDYDSVWRLGWNEADKLGFYIKDNWGRNKFVSVESKKGLDGEWHILRGSTVLEFQIDENDVKRVSRDNYGTIKNFGNITIGWDDKNGYSKVDIAEIIMYSDITDDDIEKVQEYLTKKYRLEGSSVEPIKVNVRGVSLNKTETVLPINSTETLLATIKPANGSNKNVIWESSNPSVVSVNNGIITGKSYGTATITVTTEDGSYQDSCEVNVVEPVKVVGYEARNIRWEGSFWNKYLVADIDVKLSDNTTYTHPNVVEVLKQKRERYWDWGWKYRYYIIIPEGITGTATSKDDQEVPYKMPSKVYEH